jgi:hypothetical protein
MKANALARLVISPFYICRSILRGVSLRVGTTGRGHYGDWTLGVALLQLDFQLGRDPGIGIVGEVDIVLPHQIFIQSQSGEQVFVGGPLPRSMWGGSFIQALSLRLDAVGTGVAFVAFDLAASTERTGVPVQPLGRRRWK